APMVVWHSPCESRTLPGTKIKRLCDSVVSQREQNALGRHQIQETPLIKRVFLLAAIHRIYHPSLPDIQFPKKRQKNLNFCFIFAGS
ncbi:MAG: hypothetical protein ACRAUW_10930, partial [Aeromonas sp.]|uniref:hypothetical protein n=1 Tax=Aeromonas sp. TaxID=647 RepID=UPI003D6A5CC9